MTDALLAGHVAARDFRVGHVLSRTTFLFARNFPTYFVVAAIAGTPPLLVSVLVPASPATVANPFQNVGAGALTFFLTIGKVMGARSARRAGLFEHRGDLIGIDAFLGHA
jgi:hypothetical protein